MALLVVCAQRLPIDTKRGLNTWMQSESGLSDVVLQGLALRKESEDLCLPSPPKRFWPQVRQVLVPMIGQRTVLFDAARPMPPLRVGSACF
jgi:hypothetical protein